MKINCAKCGKRFDADEHMYICPKCNHYHSQVGVRKQMTVKAESSDLFRNKKSASDIFGEKSKSEDLFKQKKTSSLPDSSIKNKIQDKFGDVNVLDMIDDFIAPDDTPDETPEFIQTVNGEQAVYTQRKRPEQKESDAFLDAASVGKKIGLAICIIIGFIMAISSATGDSEEWFSESDMTWSDDWETSYEAEVVDYGEPIEFGSFTVNIGEVTVPEYNNLNVEDNNKLIQINFTTESSYEYEDESILTDVSVHYDCYDEEEEYSVEGYDYALYEVGLTDNTSLQRKLHDNGLVTEAHYSGNYFWIFEVPKAAEEIQLQIISYVLDSGSDGSYVQDESYVMPIEL